MGWKFIKENKNILPFKTIRYRFIIPTGVGVIVSYILSQPQIGAIFVVLFAWSIISLLWAILSELKICRWINSGFIVNLIILIICFLIALPFWSKLVYWCDRDNPYKKPLLTGEGRIEVTVEPNGEMVGSLKSFAGWGCILLANDSNDIILEMGGAAARRQIENGQWVFFVLPKLDAKDKSVNKPVHNLTTAKDAAIMFERLPPNSRIIDGNVSLSFNSSVLFEIPMIPSQIMDGNAIIIKDVQKYFKKNE